MATGELAIRLMTLTLVFVPFNAVALIAELSHKRWSSALIIMVIGIITIFLWVLGMANIASGLISGGSPSRVGTALTLSVVAIGLQIVTFIGSIGFWIALGVIASRVDGDPPTK